MRAADLTCAARSFGIFGHACGSTTAQRRGPSIGRVTPVDGLAAHGARATSPALARPGVAVACTQGDAYRELVEYCWRLVDAERKRLFKYTRPPP